MPEISRFYGIIIKMYFAQKEHNPPHIHAIYGNMACAIDINTLEILDGKLPDRALVLVKDWIRMNQKEIMQMWRSQNFKKIPPLE